ncbi:MAG: HEAT repeat domain-containing protein [Planctomycetes bacterium]|nr:HEAT repeat domain-containing protein [Planctomycetota bacterium]
MNRTLAAANAAALAAIVALAWQLHASIGRTGGLESRLAEARTRRTLAESARRSVAADPAPKPEAGLGAGPSISQSAARVAECLEGIIHDPARAWGLCSTLADLDPDTVLAGLRERWKEIADPKIRRQLLQRFCQSGRLFPRSCDFLDLYLTDPDPGTRLIGAEQLRRMVLRDFEADPEGYAEWRKRTRGLSDGEVWGVVAEDFLERIRTAGPEQMASGELLLWAAPWSPAWGRLRGQPDLTQALSRWIGSGDTEAITSALYVVDGYDTGEEFLRNNAVPFLANPDTRLAAIHALSNSENRWAIPELTPHLQDSDPEVVTAAADALCEIGDLAALPDIIEAMKRMTDPERLAELNSWSLQRMTGVCPHSSHDAAWWARWWAENGERLRGERENDNY